MPEVFWIGEVCDADQRAKLTTEDAKEWFATRTIEMALLVTELKQEARKNENHSYHK